MNIAICDDEKEFLNELKELIANCYPDNEKMRISEFYSGEQFLTEFKKNQFDVIILDIEMNKLSGLEVAEKIRETDKSVIIAFLTSHQEFAMNGYEVNAFRYLLKGQPEHGRFVTAIEYKYALASFIGNNVKVINVSMHTGEIEAYIASTDNNYGNVEYIRQNPESDVANAYNYLETNSEIIGMFLSRLLNNGYDFNIVVAAANNNKTIFQKKIEDTIAQEKLEVENNKKKIKGAQDEESVIERHVYEWEIEEGESESYNNIDAKYSNFLST